MITSATSRMAGGGSFGLGWWLRGGGGLFFGVFRKAVFPGVGGGVLGGAGLGGGGGFWGNGVGAGFVYWVYRKRVHPVVVWAILVAAEFGGSQVFEDNRAKKGELVVTAVIMATVITGVMCYMIRKHRREAGGGGGGGGVDSAR